MSTGDPLLAVSDLHAGYGSLQAVDGISFEVHEAETVALGSLLGGYSFRKYQTNGGTPGDVEQIVHTAQEDAVGRAKILAGAMPLVRDLVQKRIIVRRIWAIARLSIKEAWSRGIVWVCLIIPLIYLYADWYISAKVEDQLK